MAMERQVSCCRESLAVVLHRFCTNEVLLLQTLAGVAARGAAVGWVPQSRGNYFYFLVTFL